MFTLPISLVLKSHPGFTETTQYQNLVRKTIDEIKQNFNSSE